MEYHILPGSPAQVGAAQGRLDPEGAQRQLADALAREHDLQHPYFCGQRDFVRREFPDFAEEVTAFGAAAGLEGYDAAWLLHVYYTGRAQDGCSALGLLLGDGAPVLCTTNDVGQPGAESELLAATALKFLPDSRPHGLLALGSTRTCSIARALNSAGLALGAASGHPKYCWPDAPETLNLHVLLRLLAQHCGDCDDVRHFLKQYRVSGEKGLTGVTVDAGGEMLGFELESRNVAFRAPETLGSSGRGAVLEVNHWQHPELSAPSRGVRPAFWGSPYYLNSQNRVQCFAAQRDQYGGLEDSSDLLDLLFGEPAPGQLLQRDGLNIDNWVTAYAAVIEPEAQRLAVLTAPLDRERAVEVEYGRAPREVSI